MDNLIFIIAGAILLLSSAQATQSENTGVLSYHNGTLTKIICSAATPTFLINGIYTSQHYDQLPGLFGIEARVADDRSNVTLLVNGSIMAHNVTVECQNFVDLVRGIKETLFQFTLLFNDTIPAPRHVQYDEISGSLRWSPPLLKDIPANQSVNVALRISHYVIYLTNHQTGATTTVNTDGPETNIAILNIMPDMPCPRLIQVSAVNPAGEGQRSENITNNKCHLDVMHSGEDPTTQNNSDTEKDISAEGIALSSGGAVAVVVAVVSAGIIVVCITLLTVCYYSKYRRNSKTTQSKSIMNEENPEETCKPRSSSELSDASEDSKTELLTPSGSPMTTPKQPTSTHLQVQSLVNKEDTNNTDKEKRVGMETQLHIQRTQNDGQLIYAELAPPVVNPVSQPSSVENTAYAVISHTNQTD